MDFFMLSTGKTFVLCFGTKSDSRASVANKCNKHFKSLCHLIHDLLQIRRSQILSMTRKLHKTSEKMIAKPFACELAHDIIRPPELI